MQTEKEKSREREEKQERAEREEKEAGKEEALEAERTDLAAIENLVRSGAVVTKRGAYHIHTVSIIGQIEGHYALGEGQKATQYEHLIPMLVAAENSDVIDGVLIILNTMGGDVEAGLALSELIAGMSKPTVSLVLGGGHSIGVPLAVSADRSFIVPSATMTLHPVRMNGLVLGVHQSFSYFYRMQERIIRFIADHSRVSPERLKDLMLKTGEIATDMGSVIDGEQAVREGLIDAVGGLSAALAELEKRIAEKARATPSGS